MKKRVFCSAILLIVIICICCFNIFANDLAYLDANTSVSGWSLWTPYHKGTKNMTYAYLYSNIQSAYQTYFEAAMDFWGNNINMTYTTDWTAAELVIYEDTLNLSNMAETRIIEYDDATGHHTLCTIVINPVIFNLGIYTDPGRNRAFAHEIGHAYGLDHATSASSIMYDSYSETNSVTSSDIWGMKVVTHQHVHGTLFMGTYEVVDATYHTITCNSCKGKVTRVHAPNAYGVCACGYTGPFLYP